MSKRRALLSAGVVAVVAAVGLAAWTLTGGPKRGAAVAATVNGDPIHWTQVDAEVKLGAAMLGLDPDGEEFARRRGDITRSVMDRLISAQIIIQEARKRNLVVTDKEIEAELLRFKRQFSSEQDFNDELVRTGMTLALLRDVIRLNLTRQRVAEAVTVVDVTEDEMRRHFASNRAQYDRPPQMRIAHILFRIDERGQEAMALAKARIVQARLAEGESFEELAMKYSDDAVSAAQGGSLGYVDKGTLAVEFEDVAWALKPGQVGGPVKTKYGLHLIKAYEMRPAQKAIYDQVKAQVREQLLQAKRKQAFDAWLDRQWKSATIEHFNRP